MNFMEIVIRMADTDAKRNALKAGLPKMTLEQYAYHHLMVKCALDENLREMARLTAGYLSEYSGLGIQEVTKTILRDANLKNNPKHGVGYPHSDGTNHYFKVTKPEDEVEFLGDEGAEDPHITAIKETMSALDWYYHFTDYNVAYNNGEKAYDALVEQCQKAGLTEDGANALKADVLLAKGYKEPFEGTVIIRY